MSCEKKLTPGEVKTLASLIIQESQQEGRSKQWERLPAPSEMSELIF